MSVRGIRGAITVEENTREAIFHGTQELIRAILRTNHLEADDIAAVFLTTTPDLNADFPAYAAREMGWTHVPLLGAQEIAVPGAMPRVIRVLLLVNTNLGPREIRHQYLGEAATLRPDISKANDERLATDA